MAEKGRRIVFKEPCVAELEEFDVRDPEYDEVQVKMMYSLISAGTEKAYLSATDNTAKIFPSVPGYSSAGVVCKVGKNVTKFKEGDRVFVSYGGHASYSVKKTGMLVQIPDGVSFEEAAFTRVASFPLLAIRRARLEIGESCVIVGLGMLGLFGVQLAKIGGANPIIAIGNREIRQEKAKKYGAELVLSPSDTKLTQKIYDYTLQKTYVKGANVIIETSGTEKGLLDSLKYTSMYARVLVNGCNRIMTQPVDFYKYIHLRGVQIIGAHDSTRLQYNSAPGNWTPMRDYITLLNLIKDGRLNAKDMIGEIVSPNDAYEVYTQLLKDKEFPLGVLFDWSTL